ncbi:MAG: response regulator transcription factor [Acidobacteria bacterium]|nr:MAG: response regulator transcription factor [Acidobacteriota bacterium]
MSKKILVIEDEREIARLVEIHLRDQGWEVTVRNDGASGLAAASSGRFDLVVLDLMLPGVDGLEVCRRIRAASDYLPILMLTARSSELDRVLGLEIGADDYLTKPFSVRELVARVKAILRREEALSDRAPESRLELGELTVDMDRRQVTKGEQEIELTAKEFDLLAFFAAHPGRVYSRAELLDHVWGYGHGGYEHTVNSHINRLRAKIEDDPGKPELVLTVWGVGYKFAEPAGADEGGS